MKNYSIFVALVAIIAAVSSCGSSKQATSYKGYQTSPSNPVQAEAANRGVKLELEECEAMATDLTVEGLRTFGQGESAKETFATNKALLDARSKMAQQIRTRVKGMTVQSQGETHVEGSYTSLSGDVQTQKWDEFVSNAKVIKKNTYVKTNGQYNVYVCIEMPKEQLRALYTNLSEQKAISANITEKMFIEGLKLTQE